MSSTRRLMVFLLMGLVSAVQAQVSAPSVTNVRAVQRTGTKIVDITYDLSHPGKLLSFVSLEVSQDGGVTYAPVTTVSGALGPGIFAGTGKAIDWRAATDWTPSLFSNVKVRVKADDAQDMVLVPGGTFEMGYNIYTPVTIQVSPFYIGRTEVTFREWKFVRDWGVAHGYTDLADTGRTYNEEDARPVHNVSWYQVVKWLNAKSEMEGLAPLYFTTPDRLQIYRTGNIDLTEAHANWSASGYRLPTEAEWEKAARGGKANQVYATGSAISVSQANLTGYYPNYNTFHNWPTNVGQYTPTGFGLFDVAGNVAEWCWDRFADALPKGTDPKGPSSGGSRLVRGGYYGIGEGRIAARESYPQGFSSIAFGFRAAQNAAP